MVPSGWTLNNFNSVAELIHGFQFREHHFSESGVPIVKIASISHLRGVSLEKCSYISEEIASEFSKYQIEAGDVLMALTGGTLGKTCKVQEDIEICLQNYRVGNFKPKASFLDKDFLYYFLISFTVQKRIENIVNEAAQPNVGKADFDKIKVLTPPLPEQRKIAKILSTWDKAISTTERLIDNSKQQKKALMQQLLTGKKRLLDDSGKPFEGEFDRVNLSELVTIDKSSLGKKTPEDFEFSYISLSDVETGKIADNLEKHVFSSSPSRARRKVSNGDILLATVRPNLKGFAKVKAEHDGMIASTGFSVLTPKKGVSGDYLYHYLFSCHITGQINALVVGSNYPAINSSDVSGLKVYIPSYDEQKKVACVLNNADQTLSQLEQELADLKQEKKALMQQLLTGKRRVTVS